MRTVLKKIHPIGILAVFITRIQPGYRTYQNLRKKYPRLPASKLYFMDYAGSGDTYLCCSYLKRRGLLDCESVFIAPSILSSKIASLFGAEHIEILSSQAAFSVTIMERFYGNSLSMTRLLYESEPLVYSGVLRHMQGHNGLNFMSMLKFGIDQRLELEPDGQSWAPPQLLCDRAFCEAEFKRLKLIRGKTAILAPYAAKHSTWEIPLRFYQDLADVLNKHGFTVCTNSCDPVKEPVLAGTSALYLPHQDMVFFCELAGYFIGIRSGLCDIISAARLKKKIILYPEGNVAEGVTTWLDFFSLKNMGLCKDAIELTFKNNNYIQCQYQIIEKLRGIK